VCAASSNSSFEVVAPAASGTHKPRQDPGKLGKRASIYAAKSHGRAGLSCFTFMEIH